MRKNPKKSVEADQPDAPAVDKAEVKSEIDKVKQFLSGTTVEDFKSGDWFAKLIGFALSRYSNEVDAEYFRRKYPDLPADAIADARIALAARYASLEGGLTATAYTGAIAATIGSAGGASPLSLPAGALSFVTDLSFTSVLQLRLAYDLSVIYRVPLNLDDPEDLWKLIRVAFLIKSGEGASKFVTTSIPSVVRPIVKKIFSKGTLTTVKSLPVVGKYLLQRNLIKFAIPGVTIPLSTAVNHWTTAAAGRYAKTMFRREARIIEEVDRIDARLSNHDVALWALYLIMQADKQTTAEESLYLHHLTRAARARGIDSTVMQAFTQSIEVKADDVWSKIDRLTDAAEKSAIYDAAMLATAVDGKASEKELVLLQKLAQRCDREFDVEQVLLLEDEWS